jgi:hypothetical protein
MKMKKYNRHLIFMLCLLFSWQGYAQKVKLQIITPPHSAFITDVLSNPDLFQARITNTTNENLMVKIGARALLDLKVISEANVDKSNIYTLKPGLNIYNLEDVYAAILAGGISLDAQFQQTLQSGQWPSGVYQWCFDIKDANSSTYYIQEQCSFRNVTAYSTPYLMLPQDKQVFTNPPSIIFRWMPVTPAFKEGPVTYKVRVFEVKTGQTPTQAMQTNFPVVDKAVTDLKFLSWPTEVPIEGGEYIWTVEAKDKEDRTIGLPDKYAPPFTFKVVRTTTGGGLMDIPIISATFPEDKAALTKTKHAKKQLSFDADMGSKTFKNSDSTYFKLFLTGIKDSDLPKTTLDKTILNKKLLYESAKLPLEQLYSTEALEKIVQDTSTRYAWRIVFYNGQKKYESATYTFLYSKGEQLQPTFDMTYPAEQEVVKMYSADSTKTFKFDYKLGAMAGKNNISNAFARVFVIPQPKKGKKEHYADSLALAIKNNKCAMVSDSVAFVKKATRSIIIKSLGDKKDSAYIWQVYVYHGSNTYKSNVQVFGINRAKPKPKPLCACETDDCAFPKITNKVPKPTISVEDEITLGHYKMKITDVTAATGASAAGKAKITSPFGLDVLVSFKNLKINTDNQVFSGAVQAQTYDIYEDLNMGGDMKTWKLDEKKFNSLEKHFNALEDMIVDGVKLPFSIKQKAKHLNLDLPFDLIVTNLYFSTDKAYMNLLMAIPIGEGKYAKFSADTIQLHKNGFNLDKLRLAVAEDFVIPYTKSIPIQIFAAVPKASKTAPLAGSYVQFDCKGLQEFNLNGKVTFPKNTLVKVADKSKPATTTLTFNFKEWGDFIAGANFDDFEIKNWEGNQFVVQNAVLDKSYRRNPKGIVFPKKFKGDTTSKWQGYFIKKTGVTMEEFPFFSAISSAKKVGFIGENILVDSAAFSGRLWGKNLIDFKTDEEEPKWQFSIDTMMLDINQNVMQEGRAHGKINFPLLKAPSSYAGEILRKKDSTYIMHLKPTQDLVLDFWKANLGILEGSKVTIEEVLDKEGLKKANKTKPDSLKLKRLTKKIYYADLTTQLAIDINLQSIKEGLSDTTILTTLKEKIGVDVLNFEFPTLTAHNMKFNHPDLKTKTDTLKFDVDSISHKGTFKISGIDFNLREVKILKDSVQVGTKKLQGLGILFKLSKMVDIDLTVWATRTKDTSSWLGLKYGKVDIKYAVPKFTCSVPDSLVAVPKTTKATIAVGKPYKVGGFEFKVTKLASSNSAGEGTVRIPYLGTNYKVNFGTDLTVNTENEVFEGSVYTVPAEGVFAKEALVMEKGALKVDMNKLKITKEFITTLQKAANSYSDLPISFNKMMSKINEVVGFSGFGRDRIYF